MGDRTHAKSKSLIQVPFVRKLSSRLFNIISRLLFVSNISDTQCGLKGFSRELAHSLVPLIKDNRFGGDLELLTLAQKYNIYLTTVPVTLSFVGNSSVSVIRDSVAILLRALSTIYHWWTGGYPRSLSKVNARKT